VWSFVNDKFWYNALRLYDDITVADVKMQLPMYTSGASHSTATWQLPSRNLGPVAGNQPIRYSGTLKSVRYLDEYVRFMETNNQDNVKDQACKQLGNVENGAFVAQTLQEAINNGGSGQFGNLKVDVGGKKSAADFGSSCVIKSTCAASQDSTAKSYGDSLTLNPPGIVQKSTVVADNLGSDSVVETKHLVMKTDEIEHEESEFGKTEEGRIKSRENETGRIKTEKDEAEVMGSRKTEMETLSVFMTSITPMMTTVVSGVECKELNGTIEMTGLASASDSSKMESHKKVMSALGGLLELKKQQSVGPPAGVQDASSHCMQEMTSWQKCPAVSVTPISSLQTLKLCHDMKLDTGQTFTQLSDSKVPESPVLPTVSKDSTNSGRMCSIFKVDVPCKPSGMEKPKSEPKPQTEFRIQINRNNEMYLCNTETGEIKPLNTVKPVKKSSQSSSRSTSALDEPGNVPADSKRLSLGLPLHPVRVAESQQNRVSDITNIVRKLERSNQVTKIAHSNIPVCGMSATPPHVPKPSPSQMMSRPVTSVSKLIQSELVIKPSQVIKASTLSTPLHAPKLIASKPSGTVPLSSKEQSAATLTSNQKLRQRKSKYNVHKARGKNFSQTTELQEALESCVESMFATDKEENPITLFRPGKNFDAMSKAERLLTAGTIQISDVPSSKNIPQMSLSDKQWPSLGHEVTVETTDATPPLLEASPPLLELASSHQLTSSSEEGSNHPPQLTPESNTSIRTASTTHVTAKNRRCKFW
jgi:hypothetical protein